jgi:hypothetical protein
VTRLGDKDEPLKSTIESLLKSFPLMVNTNVPPPALVLLGEIEVTDGAVGQEQDTAVASAITSTYKTDDLATGGSGVHRWQTGSGKRGAGKRRAIQQDGRDHRDVTTGPPESNIIRLTCKGDPVGQ